MTRIAHVRKYGNFIKMMSQLTEEPLVLIVVNSINREEEIEPIFDMMHLMTVMQVYKYNQISFIYRLVA